MQTPRMSMQGVDAGRRKLAVERLSAEPDSFCLKPNFAQARRSGRRHRKPKKRFDQGTVQSECSAVQQKGGCKRDNHGAKLRFQIEAIWFGGERSAASVASLHPRWTSAQQ